MPVSGLLWNGPPRRVLELTRAGIILLFSSAALLDELGDVLGRSHLASRVAATGLSPMELLTGYRALIHLVTPPHVPAVIADDPDDDAGLACAVAAGADVIVSGDGHLLGLGTHQGIEILVASQLVERLANRAAGS